MLKRVRKYLDLSLAHITPNDYNMLEHIAQFNTLATGMFASTREELDNVIVYAYEYGFFIPITDKLLDDLEKHRTAGYSDAFIKLIKYAKEKDCKLICLDRDAEISDELERFEW